MRINNNLMAMNTHRQLGINANNGSKSIEKLSSGYRINRAGDDAAGLAISEKMRSQIRGLNQASRNAQDGISLIQTAEGALNETQAILQRMRELSVQSATDTNNDDDRGAIQDEITQLKEEIDRIANTTEFNNQKLLDGTKGATTTSSEITGDTAIEATAAAKIEVTDGSETANNVIGFKVTDGGTVYDLELEIAEGSYDDIVSFTNAFNTALDAAAASHLAAGGTDISGLTDHVRLAFDVDATTDDVQFKLDYDGDAAIATADEFQVEFNNLSTPVAEALGITGDLTFAITAGGTAEAKAFQDVAKDGTGTEFDWDQFTVKFEDGVEQTANQNNEISLTFDGLDVTAGIAEANYDSNTTLASAIKDAVIGKNVVGANENNTEYATWAGAKTGANFDALAADATSTDGLIKAVDDLTVADLEAKGYNGALNDMKSAYFDDLITDFDVSFSADNNLQFDANFQMEIKADTEIARKANTLLGIDSVNTNISESGVTVQIGANENQTVTFGIGDMRQAALGAVTIDTVDYKLEDVNVSSKDGAQKAIEIIDQALKNVSDERASLGAYQNRLEHTIKNLDTSAENLQASESRIRDVDMAKEMMTFTKNNILQQAAQSMLAQANQAPQGVLQLLR